MDMKTGICWRLNQSNVSPEIGATRQKDQSNSSISSFHYYLYGQLSLIRKKLVCVRYHIFLFGSSQATSAADT